jgi:hypothetical protein
MLLRLLMRDLWPGDGREAAKPACARLLEDKMCRMGAMASNGREGRRPNGWLSCRSTAGVVFRGGGRSSAKSLMDRDDQQESKNARAGVATGGSTERPPEGLDAPLPGHTAVGWHAAPRWQICAGGEGGKRDGCKNNASQAHNKKTTSTHAKKRCAAGWGALETWLGRRWFVLPVRGVWQAWEFVYLHYLA